MPVPVMDRDRLGGTATRQQGQGFDTRKAAEQYNAGVIASLHSGQYVVPNKITTGEYLTGWLGAIRSTIKVSTRKGLVIRSVARDADPPRSSTTTADIMRTWTGAETGQFLKQVVDHRFGPLFVFLASTGCRRGEALGRGARWRDNDLVFPNHVGEPNLRRRCPGSFGSWLTRPGFRRFGCTTCGTAGHRSLEAGIHPKVVQERLGHPSIAITLGTYSHVAPAMHDTAAAKVGE